MAVRRVFLTPRLRNTNFVLAVIFALLLLLSTIALVGFVSYFSVQYQYDLLDDEMREIIGSSLIDGDRIFQEELLIDIVERRSMSQIPTGPYVYLLWNAERGNQRVVAGNLQQLPDFEYDAEGRGRFRVVYQGTIYAYYGRAVRVFDTYVLLVGRKVLNFAVLSNFYFQVSVMLVMALLAILGSWLFSRFLAKRMRRFNATIQEVIAGTDLSRRVKIGRSEDHIERTAVMFNEMLERIQLNVENSKLTTKEIAHQMTRNLWNVESNIVEAKSMIANLDDQEAIIERVNLALEASGELRTKLKGLFELLRIKNAPIATHVIRLAELIHECDFNRAESESVRMAGEKQLRIDIDMASFEDIRIRASKLHLKAAVRNLFANAVKYTPDHGLIGISAQTVDAGINLVVVNSGRGIPPEYRSRVCEAFFRLDDTNDEQPGAGMGLNIVSDVAQLHRVRVEFDELYPGEDEPGLKVVLGPFPAVAEQPDVLPVAAVESQGQ